MDQFIFILAKELNILQLAAICAIGWFFYNRLKIDLTDKIQKTETKLEIRLDKLEDKVDKLDVKIQDIDKRLFAVETMMHMKDCCMLKDERRHLKDAE